jgi:hypothetical protein
VVTSSPDIAYELFEKGASIYSDRCVFEIIVGLYVCELNVPIICDTEHAVGWVGVGL